MTIRRVLCIVTFVNKNYIYAFGVRVDTKGMSFGATILWFLLIFSVAMGFFSAFWGTLIWLLTDHSWTFCLIPGLIVSLIVGSILQIINTVRG